MRIDLRLKPDEALVLRAAWRASGVPTLSGFVAKLAANGGNLELIEAQRDRMVDVSRLAAAASQAPAEMRRLRGDLLRLGGLIKSLFIRGESMNRARPLADECAETLDALLRAADRSDVAYQELRKSLDPLRGELSRAVRILAS